MAKQLNIDMRFNADTTKAKQAITDLEQSLQKLGHSTMPKNAGIDPAQFEKASAAARELEFHLKNAFNAKTGNLDLSKLQASLQQSGTNLKQLTSQFSQAGTLGTQAFTSLARAIASADQPSLVLNTHLATMVTTLKNVARFQISSSIMHGLIGGIQSAYGYAKDLNQSLNNIRIVTGQNTDQMARFAEQANKTARALSASTLDYTDAALIYYQQGLSDADVKARTDVTVKLANVSRQSAEEVSSQMTAIWNNFDDGSHSMEYFADVITALGATTASSSEEIAKGLSQFAPIAGTIGLSYDKAASAMAAIIANTRQSAETVGTGLRTIFSRFESLKLGETLEDGVDLNKYTKAMQTIGVNVLDANGKLRDMDSILDDVAAHWEKLDNTQKTAFATTVGGVRQYTNLMALFENWDDVQANMLTATGAEGTLQQQADIYAESWEAARDRVQTALQSIFQALLKDDFFITITKGIEHILVGVRSFIDSFGGVKAILESVLAFTLSIVANKIGPAVRKIVQDIQILSGGANQVYSKMQADTTKMINDELSKKTSAGKDVYNSGDKASLQGSKDLLNVKTKLSMVEDQLSTAERMRAEIAISGIQKQIEANEKLGRQLDDLRIKNEELTKQHQLDLKTAESKLSTEQTGIAQQMNRNIQSAYAGSFAKYDVDVNQNTIASLQAARDDASQVGKVLQEGLVNAFAAGTISAQDFNNILQQTITQTAGPDFYKANIDESLNEAKAKLDILKTSFGELTELSPSLSAAFKEAFNASTAEQFDAAVDKIFQSFSDLTQQGIDVDEALERLRIPPKNIQTFKTLANELRQLKAEEAEIDKILEDESADEGKLTEAGKKRLQVRQQIKEKEEELKASIAETNAQAENLQFPHVITATEALGKLASGIGGVATSIRSVMSLFDALTNVDLSFGEAFMQSLMAISMLIPGLSTAFSGFGTVIAAIGGHFAAAAAASLGYAGAEATTIATTAAGNIVRKAHIANLTKEDLAKLGAVASTELLCKAQEEGNLATLLGTKLTNGDTVAHTLNKGVKSAAMALEIVWAAIKGKVSKATAVDTLKTLINTGAVTANFVVKTALAALEGNYAGVVLALVVAGLAAGTIALITNTRASKAAAAAKVEEAQKNKEAAESAKQEADANKELYESYQKALKNFKETGEGKEELDDIARQLADAYEVENAALLIQAGRYEELNKLLKEHQQLEQEELTKQAEQNFTSAYSNALEQSTVDHDKYWQANSTGYNRVGFEGGDYSGNATGTQVGGFLLGGIFGVHGDATTANGDMAMAYQRALANGGINTDYVDAFMGTGDLVFRTTDTSTAALIAQYEAIQATKQAMEDMANEQKISATELTGYTELNDYLSDNLEWYQQLIDARKLLADTALDGIFINSDEVTNLAEYQEQFDKYKEEIIELNKTKNLGYTEEDIDNLVQSYMQNKYSELTALREASLRVSGTYEGKDFETWFSGLTKEEQEIVLKLIPVVGDKVDIGELVTGLGALEGVATFQELQTNSKLLNDLITLNKSGTATQADWEKLYNSNPEYFKSMGYDSLYDLLIASTSQREEAFAEAKKKNDEELRKASDANKTTASELQTELHGEDGQSGLWGDLEGYTTEITVGKQQANRAMSLLGSAHNAQLYGALQIAYGYKNAGGSLVLPESGAYEDVGTGESHVSGQDIAWAMDILKNDPYFKQNFFQNYPDEDSAFKAIGDFFSYSPEAGNTLKSSYDSWRALNPENVPGAAGYRLDNNYMGSAYASAFGEGFNLEEDLKNQGPTLLPTLLKRLGVTDLIDKAVTLGGENLDGTGGLIGEKQTQLDLATNSQLPEYGNMDWLTQFQTDVAAAGFNYDEIRNFADALIANTPEGEEPLELEDALQKALELKIDEKKSGEAQKIVDSLKNTGDIISAEDFAKLPEGMSQYFQQMEDGSYRLITSVDALQEGFKESQIDEYTQKVQSLLNEGVTPENNLLIEQYQNQVLGLITSVGQLQDADTQLQFTDEQLQNGYINLASATEEGRAALTEYNYEMSQCEEGSDDARKATEKFQKKIKDIQANKAAEQIKKIVGEVGTLTEELSDFDAEQIAQELRKVFGKDVTAEFVQNNKELVNQWLNGTDEERQVAADTIDIMTGMQHVIDNINPANSAEAMDYLINQLEASSEAAKMFANDFARMKQLIETGSTELDGITFNIDGSADMTQAIQALHGAENEAELAAKMIEEAGLSHVQFSIHGNPIPDMPDFSDAEAWIQWYNTNIASHPPSEISATGRWSAHAGTPQMTSGGSGGGGGGGGGKQSTKEKKDPTDERDRYHTITEKIQDATDAYDELSKAEDRAFGKERIKAMEGITNNLKLQIELQKQYLDEIRNYLEGDRAAVEALGATFDANGVITNYDDLIAELVAKYNEGVDAFNNGGLDEDAFKEQYEEPFNDAKEAIDQYVETINLLQSEELNLIDLQNDLADQFREIAAYKLELHIDIDEDELKYLDFLLEMLGENAEDAVDRLDLLGQQFNTNRDEIAAYTTAIQDLLRLRGFTDEDVAAFIRGELTAGDLEERGFTTDDIDKLREYRDAIQDNTTAMNDLAKEIEESFLNTLDDLNEKVDDAEERFEHFAAMLEHFHNVVDIVGQDALGMSAETMKLLAKAAKENAIEMVKAAKTQLDSLNTVRAQAQAQLDAALEAQKNASTAEEKLRADEAVRYWSDTISEVTNRVEQAEEDLTDALENALEGIQEMYTTMIEQATKEFERSVTGAAGSLEQLQKNFDRQKETQELYIPTYEKIYELTKLTRDINNSIDDTDNLWSKQELAKLQDEINQKMEDGVELTEHDVEELRKRYELKLAEAALEEAQDAKRTVRMSRDNEGNWSYVYTADENDVAEAEQNYEDKLYEYQQMNYQYIQDLQANIIQAQQDMADAINDLDATSFASQEEYLAEVQRIRDAAMAKISQYRDQLAQTLDQQGILYEEDWKRYNELTGYRMARDDQWVDNWNETILAQETGFETLEDMFDQITGAIGGPDEPGTYVGDITDAYAEMQASNERALNAAGTSMQTYEQDAVDAISGIDQQMEETQNQVDEFTNSMTEAMEGVSDFIGEWKNQYGEAVKSITEFNKDLYDSCNTLIKKLQDTYGVNADFEAAQAEAAAEALAASQRGNKKDEDEQKGGSCPAGGNHNWVYINDSTGQGEQCSKCKQWSWWKEKKTTSPSSGSSGGAGCFAPGTKIIMSDKSVKNIEDIQIGDIVIAYDETTKQFMPKKVIKSYSHHNTPKIIEVQFINGNRLLMTPGHPIYTYEGWKSRDIENSLYEHGTLATWLKVHDLAIGYYNQFNNIISIKEVIIPNNYISYNIEVEDCHTFIANGIVVHNAKVGGWNTVSIMKSGGYTGTWSAASARTGMYTGSWNGPDLEENGRLAFLHQKELVLNASDTENFLSAVDMVRQISQTIDLQAASRSNGWNFLLPGILGRGPDTLDQNVHIEAHFPNVTNHSEIEEAFTNLVGKASQFANR